MTNERWIVNKKLYKIMDIRINKKIFRLSLLIIIALELLSLLGYWYSFVNLFFFIIITAAVLFISLWRLEWGLLVLFIELFISSKGYLFYLDFGGISISIRIALWLVIMGVWLAKLISDLARHRYPDFKIFKNKIIVLLSVLFFFIGFAFINGLVKQNSFNNIFFDANGWFYFSLVLPLSRVWSPGFLDRLSTLFLASVIWISAKTMLLLFLFSHQLPGITYEIYRWVRESGVGEITQLQGGFYRIFFQSHIFVFIAFFMVLLLLAGQIKAKAAAQGLIRSVCLLSLFLSAILIGFSRSNWIGLAVGCIIFIYFLFSYFKLSLKKLGRLAGSSVLIAVFGLGIIIAVVKFPYPNPIGGFSATDLLKERASQLSGEAAVTSRWKLLPVLLGEIKKSPLLGYGFGKTITYETEDPRAKEQNAKGEYTTYAFEWGWLDIWLKIGLFGLVTYVALVLSLIFSAVNRITIINIGVFISLVLISTIHFFSPYLNHPLGIGLLLVCLFIILNPPPALPDNYK